MEVANEHIKEAAMKRIIDIMSGFFRPLMSLFGPIKICPIAKPISVAVKLNCTSDALVFSLLAISGRAGKYKSVQSGPMAAKQPNITAIHSRLCGMGVRIEQFVELVMEHLIDHFQLYCSLSNPFLLSHCILITMRVQVSVINVYWVM